MTNKSDDPVVNPLLDAYGNPSLVSAGQLIESAWGNSVAGRVVLRFPSVAAMNATSASVGTLASAPSGVGANVIWVCAGGATWIPTTVGARVSFRLIGGGPGQGMANGAMSVCAWYTEESDPAGVIGTAGTFTVPAGWTGRWKFEWAVEWPAGGQAGTRLSFLGVGALRYGQQNYSGQEGGTRQTGSASAVMAVGEVANVQMYHNDPAGTLSCNTTANTYFQGYYVGPS